MEKYNLGDVPNQLNGLVRAIIEDIYKKKETIVKAKLEKLALLHLLDNLKNQRFKRITIEVYPDCEKWFVDNGTDEGLLILEFQNLETNPDFSKNGNKWISELKYKEF